MARPPAAERTPPTVMALLSSPLGAPVRAVARIRASVHVKLLAGFLLITLLFIAMTAVSLRTVADTAPPRLATAKTAVKMRSARRSCSEPT